MTPGPGADFADACAALCPGFRASGPPRVARKSELLWGEVAGTAVVAKRLRAASAVWSWYFAREVALYRAFAAKPLPVRAPRLVAADASVLVIEAMPGEPLATRRLPAAPLDVSTIDRLVALRIALATWDGDVPADPPPPAVRRQLRERYLEDPTAPLAWIRDGLARAATRKLVDGALADRALAALGTPRLAFGHGDLLLRNAIAVGDAIALVDWECAGTHVFDWDLALLWTQLAPESRAHLEAHVADRLPAFLALCVFALAREVKYLGSFGHPSPRRARALAAELAALADRI